MATPLYCRKCGIRLPTDSAFCPACGASQSDSAHLPTDQPRQERPDKGTGRLPPGRMLRQRYRLLQPVGRGGMGAVYLAQDAQLGDRLVAVKEMSMSSLAPQELPQAVEQFQREAHLLASLRHPNLPSIYDYFGEDDRWYLVMSFIEGGTLQETLDAAPGKRLPVNEVIRIGIQLCDVLDYLHNHQPQVIFRDLKPLNIMLTPKGQVFLIDFGIARHFKQGQTKDTRLYYSHGYAPPEQLGQSQTSPRSDIYSLGATMHQMLSGLDPANNPFKFPALQLVAPTTPAPLVGLITQMVDFNDQARPASAAEVKARLEQSLATGQSGATPNTRAEKREKQKRGRDKKADLRQKVSSGVDQASSSLKSGIDSLSDQFQKLDLKQKVTSGADQMSSKLKGRSNVLPGQSPYTITIGTKLLALLCYLLPLVGGIGTLFFKRNKSPFLRFHAWQSIVFWAIFVPLLIASIISYQSSAYYYSCYDSYSNSYYSCYRPPYNSGVLIIVSLIGGAYLLLEVIEVLIGRTVRLFPIGHIAALIIRKKK